MIGAVARFLTARPLASLAGAFILGAAAGAYSINTWRDAQSLGAEREKRAALVLELGFLAEAGRAAVRRTEAMGRTVQRAAEDWAGDLGELFSSIEEDRTETEEIIDDVDAIEDDVADSLVPRRLCDAEARAYGHDPAVLCAALEPD